MSAQQGPNPLRPYYIPPPPVGLNIDSLPPPSLPSPLPSSNSTQSYSLLPDLQDYSDYLDSPSPNDVLRNFITQAVVQYSLNLIAQPFENSKTVLQCRVVPKREVKAAAKKKPGRGWNAGKDFADSDEDEDDVGSIIFFYV